jgi:hypothetical protein
MHSWDVCRRQVRNEDPSPLLDHKWHSSSSIFTKLAVGTLKIPLNITLKYKRIDVASQQAMRLTHKYI